MSLAGPLPPPPPYRPPTGPPPSRGPRLGVVLAAIVTLVLVVAGAVTALVLVLPDDGPGDAATHGPSATSPATSTTSTPSAGATTVTDADRASATSFVASSLPTVLGYTPTGYDAHVQASLALMTPAYAATFRTTASRIRSTVIKQGATVTARTTDTGLSGIAPDTAAVLAFVQQTSRRAGTARSTVTPWAVGVTLKRSGGSWLIDGLITTAAPAVPTEPDPDRRSATRTARRLISAMFDFDYRHPDRGASRVRAVSTARFAQQYQSTVARFVSLLAKTHSVQTATILGAGVSQLSGSTATVLVTATTTSSSQTGGRQQRSYRIRVLLTRAGGTWRAAGSEYVT
ncbi:hypothetical protein [Nocardioides ultimimeridianus]